MCESDTLDKCKFVPIRFESEGWLMMAENYGPEDGKWAVDIMMQS